MEFLSKHKALTVPLAKSIINGAHYFYVFNMILYEDTDSPVRYFVTYHINLALKLITLSSAKINSLFN